jgi:hypothetical protein
MCTADFEEDRKLLSHEETLSLIKAEMRMQRIYWYAKILLLLKAWLKSF